MRTAARRTDASDTCRASVELSADAIRVIRRLSAAAAGEAGCELDPSSRSSAVACTPSDSEKERARIGARRDAAAAAAMTSRSAWQRYSCARR